MHQINNLRLIVSGHKEPAISKKVLLTWSDQMEELMMLNVRAFHKTVFDEDNKCYIIAGQFQDKSFTSCEVLDLFFKSCQEIQQVPKELVRFGGAYFSDNV